MYRPKHPFVNRFPKFTFTISREIGTRRIGKAPCQWLAPSRCLLDLCTGLRRSQGRVQWWYTYPSGYTLGICIYGTRSQFLRSTCHWNIILESQQRSIMPYSWGFGVGGIKKRPFDETHYNSWMDAMKLRWRHRDHN